MRYRWEHEDGAWTIPCLHLAAPVALVLTLAFAVGPAAADTMQAPAQSSASPGDRMPAMLRDPDPDASAPLQPGDAFGEEVTLPERAIVYLQGHSDWKKAFDTQVSSFKALDAAIARQDVAPSGPHMTIYTETDDNGFSFRAAAPVAAVPKDVPKMRPRKASRSAGRSSSCTAAPTAQWTRPMKRSSTISTIRGLKRKTCS